jgi:hypothetical protein
MSLWGETIRKIIFALAMALAVFAVPAMAGACGSDDVLGQGIYETENTAFTIPARVDVNLDELQVGNDFALAVGRANAENNLKIKKNQDSGATDCCAPVGGGCNDCGNKVNIENLKVGTRTALAVGFGPGVPPAMTKSTNNVEIVTNQC